MDRHSFSPLGPEGAGQDYILRLIEEFGRFAGKLIALISRGEIQPARKQIEAYYRDALGPEAGLIPTLTGRDLAGILNRNGSFDARKAVELAKVLMLDADLESAAAGPGLPAPQAKTKHLLAFDLFNAAADADPDGFPAWAAADREALARRISGWA